MMFVSARNLAIFVSRFSDDLLKLFMIIGFIYFSIISIWGCVFRIHLGAPVLAPSGGTKT